MFLQEKLPLNFGHSLCLELTWNLVHFDQVVLGRKRKLLFSCNGNDQYPEVLKNTDKKYSLSFTRLDFIKHIVNIRNEMENV